MNSFNPCHSQIDYETGTVSVQYDGEFDEDKAIKYAKQSYPQIEGIIIYNSPPNTVGGYKNIGEVGIV